MTSKEDRRKRRREKGKQKTMQPVTLTGTIPTLEPVALEATVREIIGYIKEEKGEDFPITYTISGNNIILKIPIIIYNWGKYLLQQKFGQEIIIMGPLP